MKLGTCVSFSSMEGMEEKLVQLGKFGFSSCQLISWNPKVWTDKNADILKTILKMAIPTFGYRHLYVSGLVHGVEL